jgi:hypothetical protein
MAKRKFENYLDMPDHFPYTPEGYLKVEKYLKRIGQFEYISTHGFSVDGLSIIQEANTIWKQRHSAQYKSSK